MISLVEKFTSKFVPGDDVASCQRAVERNFPDVAEASGAIDVAALATRIGVQIKYQDIELYEGALSWDSNRAATITVSTRSSWKRQRFTIAHELGHWILQKELLGKTTDPLFRGLSTNRKEVKEEERLANLLAAELLLPQKSVVNETRGQALGLGTVQKLVSKYSVSRMAALRRMADVFGQRMLYINVVPTYFDQLGSPAEVDEAVYLRPRSGTLSAREDTKLVDSVPYSDIANSRSFHLAVKGVDGLFQGCFDVCRRKFPVPNCDLLAIERPSERA